MERSRYKAMCYFNKRKKKNHVTGPGGGRERVWAGVRKRMPFSRGSGFSLGASLVLKSRKGLVIFKALLGLNIKNKLWRNHTFRGDPIDPVTSGIHRARHHWNSDGHLGSNMRSQP